MLKATLENNKIKLSVAGDMDMLLEEYEALTAALLKKGISISDLLFAVSEGCETVDKIKIVG